jgi:hypothetical protein
VQVLARAHVLAHKYLSASTCRQTLATSTWQGRPRKAVKTKLAWGGRGSGGPKTRLPVDGFRRAWNYVVAPPCMHGMPLVPNASDSQAKCVPNVRLRRAMRPASLTMRPASPCSGPPHRGPGRRLKPHAAAHVAAYVAQHVAAPMWAHLGPRWAHRGPHVWAHVWARFACILGPQWAHDGPMIGQMFGPYIGSYMGPYMGPHWGPNGPCLGPIRAPVAPSIAGFTPYCLSVYQQNGNGQWHLVMC